MTIKILGIAALAAALALPGVSFAQNNTTTTTDTAPMTSDGTTTSATGTTGDSEFFGSAMTRDFFTDDSMKTMRSKEEMNAAFAAMSPENQAKMKTACAATSDQSFSDMCEAAKAM